MPKADTLSNSSVSKGLQPLGERVIVKPIKKTEKTLSFGLIIPESGDKESPAQGVVTAVGPGKYEDGKLLPMGVKVGQTVLFSKYGFEEVKVDGEEYYILPESNILAIISK